MPTNYAQRVYDRMAAALPGNDPQLLRLYALLAMTTGTQTTLRDVHEAWALWRTMTNPGHKSLVPFGELSAEVAELDRPYRDAIVEVAREANLNELSYELGR